MIPSICIDTLFPELTAQGKIGMLQELGMRSVEFWGWRDKDVEQLAVACRSAGVTVTNFSAHRRGSPIEPEEHETVLAELADAQEAAQTLGCQTLMVLSNELGEGGRPLQPERERSDSERRDAMVSLLTEACRRLYPEMRLVIEPLNTRIDHPGNYLCTMAQAVDIVDRVGDSRLTVLVDFYHLGVMEEDLAGIIRNYSSYIGYVHLADIPGRGEPGSGTYQWSALFAELMKSGYSGVCGFEYMPQADDAASVEACLRFWKSLDAR